MSKQKNQLIATAALVVIFAALVAGNLKNSSKKKPVPAAAAESAKEEPAAKSDQPREPVDTAAANQKIEESQKERAELAWGRNPFSAIKASKEFQKTHLELKGISLGQDKNAFAFINNEIVKKGDVVGNYEVVEIEKDKVMLRKGGQSFYITLPGE